MQRGYMLLVMMAVLAVFSTSLLAQPSITFFYYFDDGVPPEELPLGCPCTDGAPFHETATVCILYDWFGDGPGACDSVLTCWIDPFIEPGYFAQPEPLVIDDPTAGVPIYIDFVSGDCWWTTSTFVVYPGPLEIFLSGDDWSCSPGPRPIFECWLFPPWDVQASDDTLCTYIMLTWEHFGVTALGFNIYCDEELVATCGPTTRDTMLQVTSSVPRLYAMTSIFDFGESWQSNADFGSATRLVLEEGASGDIQGEHLAGSEFTVGFDLPMATPEECPTIATLILLSNSVVIDTLCSDTFVTAMTCHFPEVADSVLTNCRLLLVANPLAPDSGFSSTDTTESTFTLVPLSVSDPAYLATDFAVTSIYPNPFNTETQIEFVLPRDGEVSIDVYNISGQHATTLANGRYSSGTHQVVWDASSFSSGVYFCHVTSGFSSLTAKLLLLR